MAIKPKGQNTPPGQAESEVWNAISILEQILQAVPGDRATLEALANAYEQVGDHIRAKDYLVRLVAMLVNESDTNAAAQILNKIRAIAPEATELAELSENIDQVKARMTELREQRGPAIAARPGAAHRAATASVISNEIDLAWDLLQLGQLTQEEYASVVHDLTEMSARTNRGTVSVLHVLQARGAKNLEKIIVALAKKYNTPVIPLMSFDLRADVSALLPMEFALQRGAMVFEAVGQEPLVAVMNPASAQLRKDVEAATSRRCHYFLAMPSEFDAALEKLREKAQSKSQT